MPNLTDDSERLIRLISDLQGQVAIKSMTGTESLGQLFRYDLDLISDDPDIDFDSIVGKRVTIEIELQEGVRNIDGFVTEFRFTGAHDEYAHYVATVRPWLWFLTRTSDCRIFQQGQDGIKTVPDIIKAVFRQNGMVDFEEELTGTYRDWIYCVQYRETDFNFISRLMEQEGIFYYFRHEAGKHTLVLSDDHTVHPTIPGPGPVPYWRGSLGVRAEKEDCLQTLEVGREIKPSNYAVNDFDFSNPKLNLLKKAEKSRSHAYEFSTPEIYDYPGEYQVPDDGQNYVGHRMDELACGYERVMVTGPCRLLAPGCLMTLEDHPRSDQNRDYLVISATFSCENGGFYTGTGAELTYTCQAELMDTREPYRSPRVTPKPVVQGCQTAIVVGPESEEIHCDEYGRVRVQFHWDRYGTMDENSSCWIRVSQAWAGKEWGSMHIPRIGQEVIVSFLEGDPDQPIITGRVFNGDNMPNWGLPGSKTQSGIVSRSTPGGGPSNYNELRMEDAIGNELLSIQAEKDEKILVKNDKTENVGHDETIGIGNDRTEKVGNDETRTVGNNETVTVQNSRKDTVAINEDRMVGKNRSRKVSGDEMVTVLMSRTHSVGINEAITVGASQEVTVGALQTIAVAGLQDVSAGVRNLSVAASQSEEFNSLSTQVDADWAADVGSDFALKVGSKINVEADDELVLKCGQAKIILKSNGDITFSGMNIKTKAKAAFDVKASGTVKIKGATVKDN
ncbi:MAG: type VI secretion system tip protein TssI/VgrG [Pseudomonadota bacterium]